MFIDALLLVVLAISVVTDLRSRKIYNKVIFPGFVAALCLQTVLDGWNGLSEAVLGSITGLGLLLIPYLLGGMGAGDVKLLALVGAFKGPEFVFYAFLLTAMLGGLMALGILFFRSGALRRLYWLLCAMQGYRSGVRMSLVMDREAMTSTYPYGVAIAGGALLSLWFIEWGCWI